MEFIELMIKYMSVQTTTTNGTIVVNMGNARFITYRPLSASQGGFPITTSLNFPKIWSKVRDVKFSTL